MKLNNGAKAIQWAARCGDEIEMPYVGKVLARLAHNDLHPFVVWSMTSEDGLAWDCYGGGYCETLDKALSSFAKRDMGQVVGNGLKEGTPIQATIGKPVPAGGPVVRAGSLATA
jgi:hypothetical protein